MWTRESLGWCMFSVDHIRLPIMRRLADPLAFFTLHANLFVVTAAARSDGASKESQRRSPHMSITGRQCPGRFWPVTVQYLVLQINTHKLFLKLTADLGNNRLSVISPTTSIIVQYEYDSQSAHTVHRHMEGHVADRQSSIPVCTTGMREK